MLTLKRLASAGAAVSMAVSPAFVMALTAPPATAIPPGVDPSVIVFSSALRRCDFSVLQYVTANGDGRPTAHIRTEGGQVVADVELATARPNTYYEVRLIQAPLPSSANCEGGSEGTAAGPIHTNGAGVGAVTLRTPIRPGATGAWVAIERPQPFSQRPAEFYTSDRIAAI
jgi:hypothetical protein